MIGNENLPICVLNIALSEGNNPHNTPQMSLLLPGIRRATARLTPSQFVCRQCLRQQPRAAASSRIFRALQVRQASTGVGSESKARFARYFTSAAVSTEATQVAKRVFPETSSKSVAYWLIGSAASVFGIVVFGGLTRLTESGYELPLLHLSSYYFSIHTKN